jgi:O-antigen ligase
MAGNGKVTASRFREIVLFVLLFIGLPALYLDGIYQPESSLKMPLLAVCMAFLLIFTGLIPGKKSVEQALRFALTRKFSLCFFALLIWMGFLVIKSVNTADALVEITRLVLLFLFFVTATVFLYKSPGRRNLLVAGPSVAVIVLSLFAFIQLVAGYLLSRKTGIPYRIDFSLGSTLGNKNSLAEVLLLCLPFTLFGWFVVKGKWKAFHAMAGVTALILLLLLKSLATWVAGVAGLLLFLSVSNRRIIPSFSAKKAGTVLLLGVILLLAGIFFQRSFQVDSISRKLEIIPRYLGDERLFESNSPANNNSVYERLLLWRNTVRMIGENPVTGAGINNWKLYLYKYGIAGTDFISTGLVHYEHPHNDFLLMFAECGLVGFVLFILMFIFLIREGLAIHRQQEDSFHRQLAALMLTVMVMFPVLSLFGYPWFKVVAPVILFISGSVLHSLRKEDETGKETKAPFISPGLFGLISLVVCGFAILVGYQRLRGEAMMFAVQDAKYKKNWPRIMRVLGKDDLPFFRINAVATPVDWYRGLAYYYDGNKVLAKEYFLKAEEQHPYHLQVLNDLGSVSEMQGDHEKALHYYTRALQVSPLNIQAILNKSAVFFNLKQADSAFVTLDRIYGNKLSGEDRKRYEKTVSLVLYAKAYTVGRNLERSAQASYFNRISDKRLLRKIYINSKRQQQSFEEQLLGSALHANATGGQ